MQAALIVIGVTVSNGTKNNDRNRKKTQEPLHLFVVGSNLRTSRKNTSDLCQINYLNLKQCHQKTCRKLDSRPIPR